MKKLIAPAFFMLALATGYSISMESWNGAVYVYMGEQRSPASMRSMKDFSAVDRKAITTSVQKQLLASAKVTEKNGFMAVHLGHPLFKRAKGTGEFACPVQGRAGIFDRVELTFIGMGINESGEPPLLVVEAECKPGSKLSEMRPIWIPIKAIMASPAQDQEMQMFGDQPVTVRLQKIPGQWPDSWVLQAVKLYRELNPSENLTVDAKGVREANPRLLELSWRQPASR
jgi:hypothetical protein